jgi:hypothetical protein
LQGARRAEVSSLLRDVETEAVSDVEGEKAAKDMDPAGVLSLSQFAALKLAKIAAELGSVLALAAGPAGRRGLEREMKRAGTLLASWPLCRHFHYNP